MDLEGKDENEAKERVIRLRKAIRAVVSCDITKDPPLPPEYMKQYDIITSTMCLEPACRSLEAYRAAIARIYKLVKPGGRIAIQGAELSGKLECTEEVQLGQQKFELLAITKEFVEKTMKEIGFSDVHVSFVTKEELNIISDQPPPKAFIFATGMKKCWYMWNNNAEKKLHY